MDNLILDTNHRSTYYVFEWTQFSVFNSWMNFQAEKFDILKIFILSKSWLWILEKKYPKLTTLVVLLVKAIRKWAKDSPEHRTSNLMASLRPPLGVWCEDNFVKCRMAGSVAISFSHFCTKKSSDYVGRRHLNEAQFLKGDFNCLPYCAASISFPRQ